MDLEKGLFDGVVANSACQDRKRLRSMRRGGRPRRRRWA